MHIRINPQIVEAQVRNAVHRKLPVAGIGKVIKPVLVSRRLFACVEPLELIEPNQARAHPVARIELAFVCQVQSSALQTRDQLRPEQPSNRAFEVF